MKCLEKTLSSLSYVEYQTKNIIRIQQKYSKQILAFNRKHPITQNLKPLGHSNVLSAYINLLIAVILSTKRTPRTQQKPRYACFRASQGSCATLSGSLWGPKHQWNWSRLHIISYKRSWSNYFNGPSRFLNTLIPQWAYYINN